MLVHTTITAPLSQWPIPDPDWATKASLVKSGIALSDLLVWRASYITSVADAAHDFCFELNSLRRTWPHLAVTDAIGWMLATATGLTPDRPWNSDKFLIQHMSPWAQAGFLADGWVYVAAGLTLAETLTMKASGTLDLDQAQMMAALRRAHATVE